jgi:hypothetical protein
LRRSIISVEDIGTTNLSCYSQGVMGYRRLIGLAKLLPSGQSLNRPPVFPAGICGSNQHGPAIFGAGFSGTVPSGWGMTVRAELFD